MRPVSLLPFVCLLLVDPVCGKTLYVSQSGDGTDGITWETAFDLIGNTLTLSASGDEIWVASGTYSEAIHLVTGVAMFGGFTGSDEEDELSLRNWAENETVIDANGLKSTVVTGADKGRLDGFVITGGSSQNGGGVSLIDCSFVLANSTVTENTAAGEDHIRSLGAGVYCKNAEVEIKNCRITKNHIHKDLSILGFATVRLAGSGAGIYLEDSVLDIHDSEISGNRIELEARTFGMSTVSESEGRGAGIYCQDSSVTANRVIISNNIIDVFSYAQAEYLGGTSAFASAAAEGGGLYAEGTSAIRIENSLFALNRATSEAGASTNSNASSNSHAFASGGAIHGEIEEAGSPSDGAIAYCTFAGNVSEIDFGDDLPQGGGIGGSLPFPIQSCILWDNLPDQLNFDGEPPAVTYSCIQDTFEGVGNIDADPLFVDPENGDFRLQFGSPCIDTASTTGPLTDFEGNPRPFDVFGFGRIGFDAYDMGAYESQSLGIPGDLCVTIGGNVFDASAGVFSPVANASIEFRTSGPPFTNERFFTTTNQEGYFETVICSHDTHTILVTIRAPGYRVHERNLGALLWLINRGPIDYPMTPAIPNNRSDIDGNGIVDARDLLILVSDWKKVTSP